jgi:hypothetical protein
LGKQLGDISGNANYDAATANWGAPWRMPTREELKELIDNCTFTWTTQNGTTGRLATGKNGNTIFFPANGCYIGTSLCDNIFEGFYWSSTNCDNDIFPDKSAYFIGFSIKNYFVDWFMSYYGFGVRPVSD